MAPKERTWLSKAAARNDFSLQTQKIDDAYERQGRLGEEPRRRRIKSSRVSGRVKASSQADPSNSVSQPSVPHYSSAYTDSSGLRRDISHVYPSSSTARTQSLFQLNREPGSVVSPEEAFQAHSKSTRGGSQSKTAINRDTGASTDRPHHGKQQSSYSLEDTIDDKKNGRNENPRDQAPEISVHLDDNVDGYYCCGCGIRRSDEHHRVRKFNPGDPAWRNFCKPCHAKHLASGDDKTMKAYGNLCFSCGFARSSHFNKEHPIQRGQRPIKNFCAYCMKQISKKAFVPTETLVGSSSDESDFESDRQQNDEKAPVGRKSGQETRHSVSHHQKPMDLNFDILNCVENLGDDADEYSPLEFVAERLCKRRSARANDGTPFTGGQRRSEWPTADGHEDNVEASPATGTKYQAPAVENGSTQPLHQQTDGDMVSGFCNSPLIHNCPPVTRSIDAPATLKQPITAKDSGMEAGSSLLTLDSNSPSKRATFSERVEVRTSPTYWQREHSEDDGLYAKFRHEHYHEELREGRKAVPLKDPLIDPNGQSARQPHLPNYGIDEESFDSWGAPGFGYNSSTSSSGSGQPHPSTLYIPKGFDTKDGPGPCDGLSDSNEMRPNPSNRQHQPYNGNSSSCDQGKENQPCPTKPIAPEGPSPPFSSFDDSRCSENAYWSNWFSQHDGPCASYADSSWCPEGPYSNYASHSAQTDEHSGFSGSFSGDYHFYKDTNFNATCPSKDQEANPDDRSFHQDSSDSAHQRYSRTSDRQWAYNDTEPFNIHEGFKKPRPRFPRSFPDHSVDRGPDVGHDTPYDTDVPFNTSTTKKTLHEPKLPTVGFAMEIPDDMSDSDVHNLLIPGYDNYVPWRETSST
ncbi:hypothetical protein CSPAE12_08832 [Colletotrichum incanum]|nr:hypothetical protein CSPAE12_08832 [Colletotrichum incanum]